MEARQRHSELYGRLRNELENIDLVDVHEHLPDEEEWLAEETDFTSLLGYSQLDLVSAGMQSDALTAESDADQRWQQIRPLWRHVRNTGFGWLCRRTLSMFFGVDDLDDSTIPTIQAKLSALRRPGLYHNLLKSRHKIRVCLNVVEAVRGASSSETFAPLLNTTQFALAQRRSDIERLEEASNEGVYSLETYTRALDTVLGAAIENGLVGIKWQRLAWVRQIHYELADPHAAESCLDRILRRPRGGTASDIAVGADEMRPFQDFIQHHLVRRAIELDLPIQIHTGIQAGSGAQIAYANPCHLVDLFLRYPQARFDLLHASYPYMRELTALTKLFPNVYVNVAWFDLLSPRATKHYLREWIGSVPTNKVFAFGADQHNVFHSCACAEMMRDTLATILAEEVAEGYLSSEEEAVEIATSLLRDNAWQCYRLAERWAGRHSVTTDS